MTSGTVASIGLLFDIAGGFFIAMSFITKTPKEAQREAANLMDGNPLQLRSSLYQSVDAKFGFLFLALGFIGQLLAYSGFFPSDKSQLLGLIVGLGVVMFFSVLFAVREFTKRYSRRHVAHEWRNYVSGNIATNANPSRDLIDLFVMALDVPVTNEDTRESLISKVRAAAGLST